MAQSSALRLVTTASSHTPTTLITPAQSRVRQNFAAIGAAWKALSITEQAAWLEYDKLRVAATSPRKLSAFGAFTSINGTLLASGAGINTQAPTSYILPAGLPSPLTVDATLATVGGALTLVIQSAAYTGLVQVYAAAQTLPGMDTRTTPSRYAIITTVDGLDAGGTNISAAYVAKYGTPDAAAQIAIQLVAVADLGERGNPLLVTTTVS